MSITNRRMIQGPRDKRGGKTSVPRVVAYPLIGVTRTMDKETNL